MTDDLLYQFDLAWALADLHLSALSEDDFLAEPAALCWTVRPDTDGVWRPDFADTEPDPIPVPTVGWLTWHIIWWWSATIDRVTGAIPRGPDEVAWPGDGAAAVQQIRDLAAQWRDHLAALGSEHTRTALWLNVELTKNISEIGQLRLLHAAGR
ncbi:DinB family protein [Mycobacterium deserti]|uniref:DinB family protein n=1 Tax=Mycobacterium deserti TaxID=2978347 RepID=A0ABT2MCW4_9MYCO|nr:DinB family protein [Mycobacterium deserti]MCT7660108.1 DinB family protein [Mycobacterium deserti]